MPLQGKWAILYYGILASLTGGWLPVRAKSISLTLFHLGFFLAFIFLPFSVFHIRPLHWSGWFTYSLVVGITFLVLKIVNTRLHLSLGSDPVPEEPPTEDSNAGEEEGEESAAGGGESKKPQDSNCLEPAAEVDGPQRMMAEVEEGQTEEALQRHRDSVSTLGFTTSSGMSQASHVMEMQGSSRESPPLLLVATSPLVVAPVITAPVGALSDASLAAAGLPMATASAVATATLTSNFSVSAVKRMDSDESFDSPLAARRSGALLDPETSILGLMSPVHRSSSTVDATSNAAIATVLAQQQHFSEGEEELEEAGIQRSASMPPAMFDAEAWHHHTSSRDRGRSGICLQQNRGSRHRHHMIQESRSEDEQIGRAHV